MFLGELSLAQTLAAADDDDPKTNKQGRVCEANFYSGELELLHDAKDEAGRLFRLAESGCPRAFIERYGATMELRALAAGR